MKCFYLKNMSSSTTTPEDFTTLIQKAGLPPSISTKKDYKTWVAHPSTDYYFYTTAEGVNKRHRADSKTNPIWVLHGVVVDYDANLTAAGIQSSIQANQVADYPVGYSTQSFSGGAHLVWEFERPINIINRADLLAFLKAFYAQAKVKKILPGMDEVDPEQYFTLHENWVTHGKKVSYNTLTHLMFMASQNKKVLESEGPSLPFDVIEKEVQSKWPGKWQGGFKEGVRGVRFWDPSAKDPSSAMLTPQGVRFFSDGGGFIPWGSPILFGPDFVRQFEADRVGGAIQNIFYDGKKFFRLVDNKWYEDSQSVVAVNLHVNGLSKKTKPNGRPSEIDEALAYITTNQRVRGAMPFIYRPEKVIRRSDGLYVNTAEVECCPMAETPKSWGEGFPFIQSWFDNLMASPEQLDVLLSWMHHSYKNAKDHAPKKGQSLFLVGPPNKGKTLFSHRLLSKTLGGHTDISQFMMGKENFNENLFSKGVAAIDDEQAAASYQSHLQFSALIKKVTANHDISMRKMYHSPVDVTWQGRVVVTLNDDPESLGMIPILDINIRDKLIILRLSSNPIQFPQNVEDVLDKELPSFARFLYDFQVPPNLAGNSRFGIASFIDPVIDDGAKLNAVENSLVELIEIWRESYFTVNASKAEWFGNTTELLREITQEFADEKKILEGVNTVTLGKRMKTICAKHSWCSTIKRNGSRGYLIKKS